MRFFVESQKLLSWVVGLRNAWTWGLGIGVDVLDVGKGLWDECWVVGRVWRSRRRMVVVGISVRDCGV